MARSLAALRQVRLSPRLLQSEQTEVHIVVYASASPFSGIGHHSIVRCRVDKKMKVPLKMATYFLHLAHILNLSPSGLQDSGLEQFWHSISVNIQKIRHITLFTAYCLS
jgi:hypothetical protein